MVIYTYILIIGFYCIITGLLELFKPLLMLSLWLKFIKSRFFFLYGLVLILVGFPLTQIPKTNPYSLYLFIIGVIIVFSGPFILIYPQKTKDLFIQGLTELDKKGSIIVLTIDAIVRIAVGTLCILAYFSDFTTRQLY